MHAIESPRDECFAYLPNIPIEQTVLVLETVIFNLYTSLHSHSNLRGMPGPVIKSIAYAISMEATQIRF